MGWSAHRVPRLLVGARRAKRRNIAVSPDESPTDSTEAVLLS
jgi:hypothetical protein